MFQAKTRQKSLIISNSDYSKSYLAFISVKKEETLKSGFNDPYPFKIVLDFGDYPIVLKKAKTKEKIELEFDKIMRKSKINL